MPKEVENRLKNRLDSKSHVRSKGLTLLEVLIALLVLSVGLIGVAVLTVQSLQNVHSSLLHSLSSVAALDFEERLWLELAEAESGCPLADFSGANPKGAWTNYQELWKGEIKDANTSRRPLFLPGFEATAPATVNNSDSAAPDIKTFFLTLTWDEERFSAERFGSAGQSGETESFRISILCRYP